MVLWWPSVVAPLAGVKAGVCGMLIAHTRACTAHLGAYEEDVLTREKVAQQHDGTPRCLVIVVLVVRCVVEEGAPPPLCQHCGC